MGSITGYHGDTAVSIQYCFISTTSTAFIIRMSDSKPSTQLLSEIEKADSKTLKDVTTVENPAAKHDMAMFGVAKFDKNKLKPWRQWRRMFCQQLMTSRMQRRQRRVIENYFVPPSPSKPYYCKYYSVIKL